MPPTSTTQVLLSPAELSYLHTSLSLSPPIRPDARSATQFRPLVAECDILAGTNGSARVCFADGTEAVVGVKAEVEKTPLKRRVGEVAGLDSSQEGGDAGQERQGDSAWVEMTVEIPGFRDDDSMPVFLASMLNEALIADGEFVGRLWINRRFHWKIYIDVWLPSLRLTSLSFPARKLSPESQQHLANSMPPTDPPPLATSLIPTSTPFTDNPPRTPIHPSPQTKVGERRRPPLRRRLGCFRIPLPTNLARR
jgi:exosome complex component RRP42